MLIKDEFLRAAIARTLQLKEEEIDEKAMERLVSLSARSAGIIDVYKRQVSVIAFIKNSVIRNYV